LPKKKGVKRKKKRSLPLGFGPGGRGRKKGGGKKKRGTASAQVDYMAENNRCKEHEKTTHFPGAKKKGDPKRGQEGKGKEKGKGGEKKACFVYAGHKKREKRGTGPARP